MGLLLHKILPVFFLPVGFCGGLILCGLFRKRRTWAIVGVLLLFLFSLPVVGDWLMKFPEKRFPHLEIADTPKADAIVVLSGAIRQTPSSWKRPMFSGAIDRFESGMSLLLAEKAPTIVFTRGQVPWSKERPPEGEELKSIALSRGVRTEQIVLTGIVGDTRAEANEVARIAHEQRWKRILLVTSAYHMPRSELAFRRRGLEVVAFPCDYHSSVVSQPFGILDFLPIAGGLQYSETAIREWYGYWFYRLWK
jgi:uncharacterized SAM-binding protein YcdF (DUF218 family)